MKPSFDEFGKEILIDPSIDYQVMMEWEKPYMKALIERLNPTGDVLEIGFGLGYSATLIQSYEIDSHTIIETDPEIAEAAREWAKDQPHHVNIVEGEWQDKLKTLTFFNSIFFDDAPSFKHLDFKNVRFYDFYYRLLRDHVVPGSKLTWYCDTPIYWVSHPLTEWSNRVIDIDIPINADYILDVQHKAQQLYLPLITFPYGCVRNATPIVFDKFLEFWRLDQL
jgi:guanidinoacetate N-methyltransferase